MFGGPTTKTVYKFAKKYNPKVKKIFNEKKFIKGFSIKTFYEFVKIK